MSNLPICVFEERARASASAVVKLPIAVAVVVSALIKLSPLATFIHFREEKSKKAGHMTRITDDRNANDFILLPYTYSNI